MAKIKDSKPKTSSGGYERVFNDKQIGDIIQKVQSTVIRNGNELEGIIKQQTSLISDLLAFTNDVKNDLINNGIYLCPKNAKNRRLFVPRGHDPDLLIFTLCNETKKCFIVELKDGDQFDTKKSDGEKASLIECYNFIRNKIPFIPDYYVCCFNQSNEKAIVDGFKGRFDINHVLTGSRLCEILNINYENIINNRKLDAEENVKYFVSELLKSSLILSKISTEKRKYINEKSFYSENEESN